MNMFAWVLYKEFTLYIIGGIDKKAEKAYT
jgi:hypothetical protein